MTTIMKLKFNNQSNKLIISKKVFTDKIRKQSSLCNDYNVKCKALTRYSLCEHCNTIV